MGRDAVFFNVKRRDAEKRHEVLDQMSRLLAERGNRKR